MGTWFRTTAALAAMMVWGAAACTPQEESLPTTVPTTEPTTMRTTDDSIEAESEVDASRLGFVDCDDVPVPTVTVVGDVSERRNPDEAASQAAKSYGQEHPDAFGGLWIDRRNGGTTVLGFTRELDRHRRALEELLPTSFAFEVVEVHNTERDLMMVIDSFVGQETVPFRTLGLDTRINRVGFGFIDPRPAELRLLAELVAVELVCLDITETIPPPDGPLDVIHQDGDDPLLRCNGHPAFRLSALRTPMAVESFDHPAVGVFRQALAEGWAPLELPAVDWGVVAAEDEWVVFATGGPDPAVLSIVFRDDRWTFGSGSPSCSLRLATPMGLQPVAWRLDHRQPRPGPTTTVLHLVVTEDTCASDDDFRERLLPPQVEARADRVLIAIASAWWYGYFACTAGPEIELEVHLAEPLGSRDLVDGLDVPDELLGA